jgi:hypothetical protein
VFKASEAPQPPVRPDVQEIEAVNRFMRDNPVEKAGGGRIEFSNGSNQVGNLQKRLAAFNNLKLIYGEKFVENMFKNDHGISFEEIINKKEHNGRTVTNIIDGFKKKLTKYKSPNPKKTTSTSTSVLRKPYSPDIEQRIIKLHQVDKLGAEAIAKKLTAEFGKNFSRAAVGKRITALKLEGVIKEIPMAERAASINQRGEFYGLPDSEKFLKIREVRDIDRTTRFKDTGKLKYNIPKDAKFKIDFKNPSSAAVISEIPPELTGVQYFKTKADAQKALDRRKALTLTQPADPDSPKTKAYLKRQKLLKRNAPFNFSAFGDFEFHHVMNIGGPIPLDTSDVAIVSRAMNRRLAPYNRRLNNIGENIVDLIETKPEDYLKKIKAENKKGKAIITEIKQKLPKEYRKLIGFNEVVPTFDNNKNVTGFIGKKFGGTGIKGGTVLADLSKNEIKGLKKQMVSDLNKFQSAGLKDKILSSTGKVLKGIGKVIKPIGYAYGTKALFDAQAIAKEQGIELSNFDKLLAVDSGDPNIAINNYMRRNDPEFAAQERAKDLAQMSDDFEEVGLDEVKPDETLQDFMANGGRAGFSNGGAAGADVDFATQLEYFLTNEDAELPQLSTYKETKNPIEVFNDIIDPRNYPYYADVLARSGVRIGEFGARILPATGKLIADAIQKGPFKIKETGNNYVQDYTDVLPSNIKGTGIFSEFLENITPTSLEKKVGLASLIEKEEQKQIDRGSTAGPKVFADTIGLGAEVTAPIFPGLKLLNSFAKARNLPNDKVTQKILDKEIDEVLETQGMNRREFLQATGAGATVVLAKMLGLMDLAPKVAKVARAAPIMDNTVQGMPTWFKDAVYAIERKGLLKSRGDMKGIEPDFFEMTLNTKLGKKKVLMSKNDTNGEITLDWTTNYYDMDLPVTITYRPGQSGKQNFLSDPEFPQSVEKYNVEVEAPEFEYKTVDVDSMGPEDTSFDSAVNLDIKEEADAVVEALEELGLGLTKGQKKDAADNFKYYNDVELSDGSGPDTMNPIDESDAFPFLDEIKRNK